MAQFPQFFSKISPFNLMLYFWLGTEVNASVFKSCQYKHSNDFNLFKHKGELYSALTHFFCAFTPQARFSHCSRLLWQACHSFHCILSITWWGHWGSKYLRTRMCTNWKKANKNQTYVHFFLLWSTKENECLSFILHQMKVRCIKRWSLMFFRIFCFVKEMLASWNNMRLSRWWQNV